MEGCDRYLRLQTDVTMPSISTENSEMCLRFQGNIQGLAYVHSKATVGNAVCVRIV